MSSTLSAHSPKFESRLVSFDALQALPLPVAMGLRHKPVPHATLVDTIRREVDARGYVIEREQLALGRKGAALFGVMDLAPTYSESNLPMLRERERGMSFGFRNATDGTLSIRGVAGSRVFVCDNLSMSGDTFALSRKNTTRLDLSDAMSRGFDRFLEHSRTFELEIQRLQGTALTDGRAKQLIFDIFQAGILPVRLFDDVARFYFEPAEGRPDCAPRSLWGVHNACTRALQDLSPAQLFSRTVALGRQFATDSVEIIPDANVIDV